MQYASLWLFRGKTMGRGIKGKNIFLTGASGFVGTRLAECLTRAYGAEVHALVRRLGTVGTARLARLPRLKMFHGDIRDIDSVKKAAQGCSHYIHCVTGTLGSYRKRKKETVVGTRNVLEAAVQWGTECVVYFSSAAVHDPARSGEVIREESPLNGRYPTSVKIPGEALVARYHHEYRLPTVVLRPTSVWGPLSPTWTVQAVDLVRRGVAFLPSEGTGAANAVYIDNLVDAVYLALTRTEAVGQTFLINDDSPKTWGELYGGYARFLGMPLPFIRDSSGVRDLLWVSLHNACRVLQNRITGKRSGIQTARDFYDHVPGLKGLVSMLPGPLGQLLRTSAAERERAMEATSPVKEPQPGFLHYSFISRHIGELYGSQSRYSSEKAKRILGWSPRISFQEALERTCQWLQYAGYKE